MSSSGATRWTRLLEQRIAFRRIVSNRGATVSAKARSRDSDRPTDASGVSLGAICLHLVQTAASGCGSQPRIRAGWGCARAQGGHKHPITQWYQATRPKTSARQTRLDQAFLALAGIDWTGVRVLPPEHAFSTFTQATALRPRVEDIEVQPVVTVWSQAGFR